MATATQPSITGLYKTADGTVDYDGDAHKLELAKGSLDKKATEFEAAKAQLYRQDGTPKYAPAELKERMDALLEPLSQAVKEAKETAEQVRQRCDEAAREKDTDPLLRLELPSEQQEVTYKNSLVGDEVAKAALPALAQRLEAVAIHGSKVEKLLYVRHARARINEEKQRYMASGTRGTADRPSTVGGPAPDGLGAATKAVEALEKATVDPKLQARLQRAEARKKATWDLQIDAGKRLADLDGSADQARQQMKARMRSAF